MQPIEQDISTFKIDGGSFRDPSGFIFNFNDHIYRGISTSYFVDFDYLNTSGLYTKLSSSGWLITHEVIPNFLSPPFSEYKIITPQKIPFISYPYEWCFSQLKAAALLTLKIQKEALKHGMSLKDASAYNIQFLGSKPIFIDTLSFEKYKEGKPWAAYGQFCRHFIAPLALISYRHTGLSKLSQLYIDGIPLELANTLIPRRSLANSVVLSHLHLHSKFQDSYSNAGKKSIKSAVLSKNKLLALIQHMEDGINGFSLKEKRSTWNNYNETHNYTVKAKKEKEGIIAGWLQKIKPITVWDLGCNTGEYSVLASKYSNYVLALDSDYFCIEKLYKASSKKNIENILPLQIDLTNPSPGIGWNNKERNTLGMRGKADLLLALALIHHLRIGNNTPWENISKLFSKWGTHLIVEFIPKEDSQIQRMLHNRENIFTDIDFQAFKIAFSKHFEFIETQPVPDTSRTLCLLKKKQE